MGSTPVESIWPARGDRAVLDRLADLVEARWQVGLARLWYADPSAARSMVSRLLRTVEMGPGLHAPAWPADQSSLDALLADLLDPGLTGSALAGRASAWMRSLPRTTAWVADDCVQLAGGRPIASIRAASFDADPVLLWVSGENGRRLDDPEPLLPSRVAAKLAPVEFGEPATGARSFTVHRGEESSRLLVGEGQAVKPPGARCGPFVHDWTLDAWAMGAPLARAARAGVWSTVALLLRDDSGASASGWMVYLECSRGSQAANAPDTVGLWFGPRGGSLASLELSSLGELRSELDASGDVLLAVSDTPRVWSVAVPVPERAIEAGALLRMGFTRTDGGGIRTAWPRRLFPWEVEPPRRLFRLDEWDGFEPRRSSRGR